MCVRVVHQSEADRQAVEESQLSGQSALCGEFPGFLSLVEVFCDIQALICKDMVICKKSISWSCVISTDVEDVEMLRLLMAPPSGNMD